MVIYPAILQAGTYPPTPLLVLVRKAGLFGKYSSGAARAWTISMRAAFMRQMV